MPGAAPKGPARSFLAVGPALGEALAGSYGPVALFATSSLNDNATLKTLGGSEGPGGELRHPPPRAGKKNEKIYFFVIFFLLRGVRGVVWGLPRGSPGALGSPGGPWGAQGG